MPDKNYKHRVGYSGVFFDRIDGLWWGSSFVWGAMVLVIDNTGWSESWAWWDARGVFFAGIGLLALICAVIRTQIPAYRSKWVFSAIFGIIFLAIGLGAWQTGWWIWAIVLLCIGMTILIQAISPKG